jgi:hypothetical protein
MLALCQYCTQHLADYCIPEVQRLAFEGCQFDSADFQISPFDIGFNNLKPFLFYYSMFLGAH